jgi:hypothetical protein
MDVSPIHISKSTLFSLESDRGLQHRLGAAANEEDENANVAVG